MRSQPRESVIHVPVDRRAARTRHPDAVALDAAVQVAAVLMLLEEGVERVEEGRAALVEHGLFDDLVPAAGQAQHALPWKRLKRASSLPGWNNLPSTRPEQVAAFLRKIAEFIATSTR
jgi:hypothetical protein